MAVQPPSKNPPVLSFPAPIFATLQPTQYLDAHLISSTRPNGRSPSEFRSPAINTNSLTHCNGSAVVRCGDTAVVCGVRGEILRAGDVPNPPRVDAGKLEAEGQEEWEDDGEEMVDLGLLVPNIELSTGCAPSQLPGAAPSNFAQGLTSRLQNLLQRTGLVRAKNLRILYQPPPSNSPDEIEEDEEKVEIKAYWTLYLDVLFISLDGNAFDAAWLAVLSALQSTVLPKASWNPDLEMIVCDDDVQEAKKLQLRGAPVPASFAVFESGSRAGSGVEKSQEKEIGKDLWVLADADGFEEGLCRENVTIVWDGMMKKIRGVEKSGGGMVGRETLREIVGTAQKRWEECWAAITNAEG